MRSDPVVPLIHQLRHLINEPKHFISTLAIEIPSLEAMILGVRGTMADRTVHNVWRIDRSTGIVEVDGPTSDTVDALRKEKMHYPLPE